MRLAKFDPTPVNLVIASAGLFLLYSVYKGGIAKAASSLAQTVAEAGVQAAGGLVIGTVTGASEAVGLPTPAQTTSDPSVARWIMDDPRGGQFQASQWSSVMAYAEALMRPAGSGTPPPPNSPVAQRFPPYVNTGGATGNW